MALNAMKLLDNTIKPVCKGCGSPISLHGAIMGSGQCRLCSQRNRRERSDRVTSGTATEEDLLRIKYAQTVASKYLKHVECAHCGKPVRYSAKRQTPPRCMACAHQQRWANSPKTAKKVISVRLEASEKVALLRAAKVAGLTTNNYIRAAIIQAMTSED